MTKGECASVTGFESFINNKSIVTFREIVNFKSLSEPVYALYIEWKDLVEAIIPDGYEYLDECFKRCPKLETIVIPYTLRSFGNHPFENLTALKDVYIYSINAPSIDIIALSYTPSNVRLHVPVGASGYGTGVWLNLVTQKNWTISYTL